ncbi:competence type IV pilus minor pilin ComGD [Pallidibacillus pasinlerensis]|uniref:competence type IV pilus minor pilin ComGD n=1 Tax=Pallidibacillus pasinlerensis TaxID=2703818 RepID=UPI00137AF6FA|nr:competence type IV pilus minor pilin ComGD [Pallidibacillus pasinlerensis]
MEVVFRLLMEKQRYNKLQVGYSKVKKGIIREEGFTLVEMLLVLFILTVMFATIPPLFQSVQSKINESNFIHQFQADLYYAQSYAIAHRRRVSYRYDNTNKAYRFYTGGENILILERKLPKNVTIERGYLDEFHFNGEGNVSRFGNIYIKIDDKSYRLVMSIGKGSFAVYEQ